MTVYQAPLRPPILPSQSIFHYLFPNDSAFYPKQDRSSVAFIDALSGRSVTRGDLEEQGRRLATGIRKRGLHRGDVACIFGLNSLEWINAMLGCQAAGVRVSPVNYG
jgi:acyl-CoA synthetase (AMP-forming)/AMP-acid ligase II